MLGLNRIFANIFRDELKQQGVSLRDLARRTGKGPSTLSEKLSGKRALTTNDIDTIARELNIKIDVRRNDD